jgi:hypothetical protein
VRALEAYCDKTVSCRSTSLLFVFMGNAHQRKAVSKPTLSKWIVDAIRLAYVCAGSEVPEALKAHSTRGVSTSWALSEGVSIGEICSAANWFVEVGNVLARKPGSRPTLLRWIVDARLAYSSSGIKVPVAFKAHSTRGMVSSWVLAKGVSIQEICVAAKLVFAFYLCCLLSPCYRILLAGAFGSGCCCFF